ncbi:hypothetical protein BKA62DRAFT_771472 [Auriculariales sp. MPI-PUGE-AT-0066]|nr:hypothetical protein BKA62DRAFT_771472 [Auriculariales sp. MPI-PUGE-AT-0066]
MSLGDDADLYGDLYGADDPDYTETAASVPVKEEPEFMSRTPPLPTKTETDNFIPSKPSAAAGVGSLPSIPAKPESTMGNGNGKPQPIPSYSSQGAQQFQSNYMPAAGATQLGGGSDALVLGGGAGAGLGVAPQLAAAVSAGADGLAGQSVRPSQMKDEG